MAETEATLLGGAKSSTSGGWLAEFRALLVLGWPLIIAQLAQNALFTTDVIMMSRLGPKYLAAGTLATAFFICFQLLGVGLLSAVAPMVAQARGSGQLRDIRRIVRQGFWVAILLTLVMTPIIWQIEPILLFLGQDPELSRLAARFTHFAVWLYLPAMGIMVLRSFLAAHGATTIILLITLAGVLLNGFANYALVFGNWGFPRLELAGSGIATSVVNFVMFAMMATYVLTHHRFRRYHVFARFSVPDWPHFWALFRVGGPIGLMLLAEVGIFSAAAMLMGRLGVEEVAAHAVAIQFASLAFMVPLGIGQAATVRVGLFYGQSNPEGIRKAGWVSMAGTLLFMTASCIIFLAFTAPLVGLFIDASNPDNARTISLAVGYLTVAALFQLVDGGQVSAASSLRGLSDTTVPLVAALIGYWAVGLPISVLLGFYTDLAGVGIWIGLAVGLAFVAVVLTIRFAMRERLGLLRARPPRLSHR
ncbi:MAG: Multidrug and toxin extrusion family efflux pump [Devosia sp.]|nr:Multidrug and toxin extrusion family efflux pump [Devosia sp.]